MSRTATVTIALCLLAVLAGCSTTSSWHALPLDGDFNVHKDLHLGDYLRLATVEGQVEEGALVEIGESTLTLAVPGDEMTVVAIPVDTIARLEIQK